MTMRYPELQSMFNYALFVCPSIIKKNSIIGTTLRNYTISIHHTFKCILTTVLNLNFKYKCAISLKLLGHQETFVNGYILCSWQPCIRDTFNWHIALIRLLWTSLNPEQFHPSSRLSNTSVRSLRWDEDCGPTSLTLPDNDSTYDVRWVCAYMLTGICSSELTIVGASYPENNRRRHIESNR